MIAKTYGGLSAGAVLGDFEEYCFFRQNWNCIADSRLQEKRVELGHPALLGELVALRVHRHSSPARKGLALYGQRLRLGLRGRYHSGDDGGGGGARGDAMSDSGFQPGPFGREGLDRPGGAPAALRGCLGVMRDLSGAVANEGRGRRVVLGPGLFGNLDALGRGEREEGRWERAEESEEGKERVEKTSRLFRGQNLSQMTYQVYQKMFITLSSCLQSQSKFSRRLAPWCDKGTVRRHLCKPQ